MNNDNCLIASEDSDAGPTEVTNDQYSSSLGQSVGFYTGKYGCV